MEDRKDEFPIKALLLLGIVWAFYEIVQTIIYAIARFLHGLVTIALVSAGILAIYWVYRHITDKQYGDDKRMREIQKLEEQRIRALAQAPEHMRDGIDEWYRQRQQAKYQEQGQSRFDLFADRFKQVFNIFRRDK